MRILKHIINWTVWTFLGLYAVVMIAVHTPFVQRELGDSIAQMLGKKLGTEVHIGRIDLGFLNRLILDSVVVYDQQHKPMLSVARMTAKVDVTPLTVGRISISSAQLFGANVQLSRPSAEAKTNFQFVIDSLASKDTTSHKPLDLSINSFIMRNTNVSYDQWDIPQTPGKLNPHHISLTKISAHIILKTLKDDSLNVNI